MRSCYSALSFLRVHCNKMISFFINFFFSLSCLSPSQVSSFSSLLSHFSSVTPYHPSFILSISPSQPRLTIFFLKSSQKTPKHPNKLPKNSTTKNLIDTIKLPFVNHTWNQWRRHVEGRVFPGTPWPENKNSFIYNNLIFLFVYLKKKYEHP